MKYNLVENSNLYSNTVSGTGNVNLTVLEITNIANLIGTKYIDPGGNLYLDVDLGARKKIGKVCYYFSSTSSSGTVVSDIEFYHRNESFESYSSLTTNIGNGYYYTTVSGISAPRYVRVVHTIASGTSVSGTVVGFSIFNDEEIVDFGLSGDLLSESMSTSVYGGTDEIKSIAIFNDSDRTSLAYCALEPQETNVDDLLSISDSIDGPWYGVNTNNILLSDDWPLGTHDNTEIVSDKLVLSAGQTEGTYRTKIFYNEIPGHICLKVNEPSNSMVTKDVNKDLGTIEVKSVNEKPINYLIYRVVACKQISCGQTSCKDLYYTDYQGRSPGSVVYESGSLWDNSYVSSCSSQYMTIDSTSKKCTGFFHVQTISGFNRCELFLFSILNDGGFSSHKLLRGGDGGLYHAIPHTIYKVLLDTNGEIWVYFYCKYGSHAESGYLVDQTGYYLAHFEASFTSTYKFVAPEKLIYDCDVVYNTRDLWYTDSVNNQIVLIDKYGTIKISVPDVNNVKGICTNSDGGCWYISGSVIKRLDENGILVQTIENIEEIELKWISRDGEDALYIVDGDYVKHINFNGSVNFSVVVIQSGQLFPIKSGVWVKCGDGKFRFVGVKTQCVGSVVSSSNVCGFFDCEYDDIYGSYFPIEIDSTWNNIDWLEVRTDDYILPAVEKYHQLRLTLRAGGGDVSPEVEKINVQKSVMVPNIYPNNYKNIYLKTHIPDSDPSWIGDYNSNLKVWWEVPTNI